MLLGSFFILFIWQIDFCSIFKQKKTISLLKLEPIGYQDLKIFLRPAILYHAFYGLSPQTFRSVIVTHLCSCNLLLFCPQGMKCTWKIVGGKIRKAVSECIGKWSKWKKYCKTASFATIIFQLKWDRALFIIFYKLWNKT